MIKIPTIQQGDIIFVKIEGKIPAEGKRRERTERGFVIAEGEASNHFHVVKDADVLLVEKDGQLFIGCEGDVIVTHEEHKPVTLPAGDYEVRRVQEYDHFAEEARSVED